MRTRSLSGVICRPSLLAWVCLCLDNGSFGGVHLATASPITSTAGEWSCGHGRASGESDGGMFSKDLKGLLSEPRVVPVILKWYPYRLAKNSLQLQLSVNKVIY